jgi:hypothetical protein
MRQKRNKWVFENCMDKPVNNITWRGFFAIEIIFMSNNDFDFIFPECPKK